MSMLRTFVSLGLTGTALAAEPVFRVADTPWDERLGSERAVVRVAAAADAVLVELPWRRADAQAPHRVVVIDAATGAEVADRLVLQVGRESGQFIVRPRTAPGLYLIYPWPHPRREAMGYYPHDYDAAEAPADRAWGARASLAIGLPRAEVLAFEARTPFDSRAPMLVCASASEVAALRRDHPQPFLLFPEDRLRPIVMRRDLPRHWVTSGPGARFNGSASPDECFAFQVGVFASTTDLRDIVVRLSGPDAGRLRCLNSGGTAWDGSPLSRTIAVPSGQVQALWFLCEVPATGRTRMEAVISIAPAGLTAQDLAVAVDVAGAPILAHGDDEAWRLSRLRWLDSTIGSEPSVVAPYRPLRINSRQVQTLMQRIDLGDDGLPSAITCTGRSLLTAPLRLLVEGVGPWTWQAGALQQPGPGRVTTRSQGQGDGLAACLETQIEFDGHLEFTAVFTADRELNLADMRLEVPLRQDCATYLMGAGQRGGRRPASLRWDLGGDEDTVWVGAVEAGLALSLLGASYHGPLLALYRPGAAPAWHNGGRGLLTLSEDGAGVLLRLSSGPRRMVAGETAVFRWSLQPTPVKPLDTAAHIRARYWHSDHDIPAEAKVVNIHHATAANPYINYPFANASRLRDLLLEQHAQGRSVKIYDTVREISNHAVELPAWRSLGHEIIAAGPGGGFPWLREHLLDDYTPQWYTRIEPDGIDAAVLTCGPSRLYNHYLEGVAWLARQGCLDGLYLDDVAFDRRIMQRLRRVLERERPGALIDLHSNNLFSRGPAMRYLEFMPYLDRLWFGEGFDYAAMSSDQWLVEASGIPFGVMADMLQDGGNPWLGMLFGETVRMPWVGAMDLRPLWRVWDAFGLEQARMIGFWDAAVPVRCSVPGVEATVFAHPGRALIAVGNWNREAVSCSLTIDGAALGMAGPVTLEAPAIAGFQEARRFAPGEAIPMDGRRGWLLLAGGAP